MRKLTLRKQFFLVFFTIIFIGLISAFSSLRALSQIKSDMDEIVTKNEKITEIANKISSELRIGIETTLTTMVVSDPTQAKAAADRGLAARDRFFSLVDQLIKLTKDNPKASELVGKFLQTAQTRGDPDFKKFIQLWQEGKKEEAGTWLAERTTVSLTAVQDTIQQVLAYYEKHTQEMVAASKEQHSKAQAIAITCFAVSTLFSFAMAFFINNRLYQSLGAEPSELDTYAQRVALGDLTPNELKSNIASRSVYASLIKMQKNIANIVVNIQKSSENVANSSSEIALGNSDLSARTETQAGNLQHTATSMEKIASAIRTNADGAKNATHLAQATAQAAHQGGELVENVVITMQEISKSSQSISEIIGVIDGIAFQTNILALNAAVEAARAGEDGRGFAVVAGEVRSLAQRSAEAAKQIKTLINASVQSVNSGVERANNAGLAMHNIVKQVQQVNDLIMEMSSAISQQTDEVEQVGNAIKYLDQVTQQNAALVEESAAAAESLKQQAVHLAEAVSIFKLPSASSSTALALNGH
ncbi:MCP four helix bundle domain-containing protein [Curvibacter sp. CHRR-16]|uniref:methyl-accepting chemotaxis protein n=1 Tax=Curvibacter sp. CHRR-16 TaxID=2835872 RepID=UPI001BD9A6A8|nr:methyl-accepting chemotaxis protein [Curvibacter sp. CHRR-16]MBT0570620.1 MCP four helix bundle domain-containing protein [Curvibacter sp. CHRR-16]